jgi:hypothetical protein
VFTQTWREGEFIPLPKNSTLYWLKKPISLSKLLEKIVFDQIQCYFTVNKVTTYFQHAFREGHSICKALTQMTDDWLRKLDNNKKIVRLVLALSIIICCWKVLWLYTPDILWIESYLSNRTQRLFFNGNLSTIIQVESGISLDSFLGPILFSIST